METIKLDLIPGKKMPSLHASQYDDGRDYHIDLTENRVPYTLDGTETISLTVRKCDNTLVTMDIANTFADKSYIEFRTTEQMNACAGFNYGEIVLEENGTRIGSLNFYLQVEGAPDEGGITSQSEINNLNRQITDEVDRILPDMVDEVAEPIIDEKVPEKVAEVAPSIVSEIAPPIVEALVPEAVGDNYYTKGETYNKTEVDEQVNEIAPYSVNLFDKSTIVIGGHYYSNGEVTPKESSSYSTQYIKINVGKTYTFTNFNLSQALFMTYNANKEVIERITPNTNINYSFGNNVAYIRISYYNKIIPDYYMFVEGSALPDNFEPYGRVINKNILHEKSCSLIYKSNVSSDTPEKIDIYIPCKNGFANYPLVHNVSLTVNADCWRLNRIMKVNNGYETLLPFTDSGELEMAVKIVGRSDYIGGLSHGDEIATKTVFIIDGKKVNISDFTELTDFSCLRVITYSNLYDPNDNETLVAYHGKEYVFTKDGLTLMQSVKWVLSELINEAYLSMLIGTQRYNNVVITDHIFTDISFDVETIKSETSRTFYENAKQASIFGETSNITCTMIIDEYPTGLVGGDQIEMRVTAGSNNKAYAIAVYYNGNSGHQTTVGELWKSKTKFIFEG